MNLFKLIFITFILSSCAISIRHTYLLDEITKIPRKEGLFDVENRINSDQLANLNIDVTVIYEQLDLMNGELARLSDGYENQWVYACYRFYPNGALNLFILPWGESEVDSKTFDPTYSGYRGVYYVDKGEIKYKLYATNGEYLRFGKLTGSFSFDGNNLTEYRDIQSKYNTDRYVKREIPAEFLDFEANW